MEDFPILLLFLIIYLIAASSGKKKKTQRRAGSSREKRARGDLRASRENAHTQKGFEAAFASQETQSPDLHQADCRTESIHLHAVSQQQMNLAQEGEDPCHAGGHEAEVQEAHDPSAMQQAQMQDVLRGVIMSEILTRPHERRMMQRNGRGYHG